MYKIDQSTQVQETASKSTIPVGINDNCELTSIKTLTDKNGNSYLSFTFTDANGSELAHNEFDVNPDYVTPKPGESVQEAVTRRVNQMMVRIKHIATKFVPENQFIVSGNDFSELCNSVVSLLTPNYWKGKKVRLKVTYNWKDYCSLPNFAPFIESMDADPSGLKINPNYDKMEKSIKNVEAEVESSDDPDLPF
jgi:hypothetical protein